MITSIVMAAMVMSIPQGGQGGAAGAAAGGRIGAFPGEEETFKHILTPGDKTDWPIQAKAGEVLILRARSTSFDPAIEVVDGSDVKIAENDDEEPGQQNALLLVYFEKEGSYKAHVKNYRSTSGGQYEFSIRRFATTTIAPGAPARAVGQSKPTYVRVVAPKGRVVALGNSESPQFDQLIAPSGKDATWLPTLQGSMERAFRVEEEGAYYARTYVNRREATATLSVREAVVRTAELGQGASATVSADGLDVWRVHAKAGDFLRVSARSGQSPQIGLVAPEEREPVGGRQPNEESLEASLEVVEQGGRWWDTMAFLVHRDGEYEFVVRPRSGTMPYTMELSNAWSPWPGSGAITGRLAIGTTAYYAFDAPAGYLARYEVQAATFDVDVDLYSPKWENLQSLADAGWRDTNLADTVFLRKGGRTYLAVRCQGNGGGGDYQVRATPIAPKPLKVGERLAATIASPLDGLWTTGLQRGTTYSIRLKGSGSVTVTDPDGKTLPVRSVGVGRDDTLILFDTTKAGDYRLWVQPRGDAKEFSLRLEPMPDGE